MASQFSVRTAGLTQPKRAPIPSATADVNHALVTGGIDAYHSLGLLILAGLARRAQRRRGALRAAAGGTWTVSSEDPNARVVPRARVTEEATVALRVWLTMLRGFVGRAGALRFKWGGVGA
jgi:hypothetical protein